MDSFVFVILSFLFVVGKSQNCSQFVLPSTAVISEVDPKGTVVVNTTDCSLTTWMMSIVSPSFVSDTYFLWMKNGGHYILSLNKTVDLELFQATQGAYVKNIIIRFNEVGGKGERLLNISVLPVNENSPTFTQSSFKTSVAENADINSTIFDLKGKYSDSDVGDYVTKLETIPARISEFDGASHFHLDGDVLRLINPLDYESLKLEDKPFYDIGFIIYDTGNKSGTAELRIKVTDIDEAPVFVQTGCSRNETGSDYPWAKPECSIEDYVVYIRPNRVVALVPDAVVAIDYDVADNAVGYFLLESDEISTNTSCIIDINNATGDISIQCNDTGDVEEEFKQFYEEHEGMEFNITLQAEEVSANHLTINISVTVHFGPPPFDTTSTSTFTTTTPLDIGLSTDEVDITENTDVSTKPTTVDKTTEKAHDDSETKRLLIIIIPSAVGGVIVILVMIIACRACRSCVKDEEREYRVRQEKLNKRQEYYAAYDNVGHKGEVNGVNDDKTVSVVVQENDLYETK